MAGKRKKPLTAAEKQNARAQALGYRNYYDYRIHDYGKRPPGEPVDPATRAKKAGARSEAAFRRTLKRPSRIYGIREVLLGPTSGGQYSVLRFLVTYTNADMRTFDVQFDSESDRQYWHDYFEDEDIDFAPYKGKE